MTEREWLAHTDPYEMLDYLRENHGVTRRKAGKRQLRLFCCACVRRVLQEGDAADLRESVLVAEQYAEGLVGTVERRRAEFALLGQRSGGHMGMILRGSVHSCLFPAFPFDRVVTSIQQARNVAVQRFYNKQPDLAAVQSVAIAETARQAELLREVFGNPFRPPTARKFPAHVRSLAQSCYEGDASLYPVLADALADLGEDAAAAHCRQAGHVKGCHIVDWVLGKA